MKGLEHEPIVIDDAGQEARVVPSPVVIEEGAEDEASPLTPAVERLAQPGPTAPVTGRVPTRAERLHYGALADAIRGNKAGPFWDPSHRQHAETLELLVDYQRIIDGRPGSLEALQGVTLGREPVRVGPYVIPEREATHVDEVQVETPPLLPEGVPLPSLAGAPPGLTYDQAKLGTLYATTQGAGVEDRFHLLVEPAVAARTAGIAWTSDACHDELARRHQSLAEADTLMKDWNDAVESGVIPAALLDDLLHPHVVNDPTMVERVARAWQQANARVK
jgi:hypothetical protein